jgi:hypothetical protein
MSMTSQERLANSNATWLIKRRQRAPWTPFIINTNCRPLTTGLINEKRRVPEHESYLPSLSLSLSLLPMHQVAHKRLAQLICNRITAVCTDVLAPSLAARRDKADGNAWWQKQRHLSVQSYHHRCRCKIPLSSSWRRAPGLSELASPVMHDRSRRHMGEDDVRCLPTKLRSIDGYANY